MEYHEKIKHCAQILGVSTEEVNKIFEDEETFSLTVVNLDISELADLLTASIKLPKKESTIVFGIKAKAAAKALLTPVAPIKPPVLDAPMAIVPLDVSMLVNGIKPLANWSDREVLVAYASDQTDELESQLIVRSKGRRFVVTNPTDSDNIDVESTLAMLKRARKEDMPEYYRTSDGSVVYLHRVNDLNRKSRIRHICPVCGGILFDDHCSVCDIHFGGLTKEQRQFIWVVWNDAVLKKSMSVSDIIEYVRLGNLMMFHPRTQMVFNMAKDVGELPSLIKIEKPYTGNVAGDPFKVRR